MQQLFNKILKYFNPLRSNDYLLGEEKVEISEVGKEMQKIYFSFITTIKKIGKDNTQMIQKLYMLAEQSVEKCKFQRAGSLGVDLDD